MNETQWRRQVLDLAHSTGWRSYYTSYSPYSTPGWPDLALIKPPVVILAELKTAHGRLRAEQEVAGDLLARCDRIVYGLWRPGDLDDDVADALGVNTRQGRLL